MRLSRKAKAEVHRKIIKHLQGTKILLRVVAQIEDKNQSKHNN